jgi:uncharacterized protein with FMN-binding domain
MRRAVLTLGGTIAGLAALLSFKTHPAGLTAETTPTPMQAGSTSSSPAAGSGAPQAKSSAAVPSHSATPKTAGGGSSSSGASAMTTRTVTGQVENTQYGPMQVQVVLTGKKITKVNVLQETNLGAESQQIDAMAIPQLTQETLTAQSARIDAVSGASYTSQGYIQSLQSALDQAKA